MVKQTLFGIKSTHELEYGRVNVGSLKSGERTLKAATIARQQKTSFSP